MNFMGADSRMQADGEARMAREDVSGGAFRGRGGVDYWSSGPASVKEPTLNLGRYWHLLLKHRYLVAATLAGAIAIGVIATLLMTPLFTASATLQIDREAARILQTEDVTPRESMTQGEEFFQTQYGVLRSRSLAERVIQSLGLAASDRFVEQMDITVPSSGRGTPASRRSEAVLKAVQKNLGVQPVRGSRLVVVTFNSPDPVLSATVANAFAENFIQANLDRKFESSSYARDFLEERLAQTKAKLEDAERQLVAYASNQQIINIPTPGSAGAESGTQSIAASDLTALNAALSQARARRIAAEEKWRQANSSALMTLPEVLQNPAIQRLAETRAGLNATYQQKLSLYRPEFPEMLQLKAQLDEADSQIASLAGNIRASVGQQYQVSVNEERALQQRVNVLKGDVLDFRSRSVQYNILQRELDTSRSLYDGLLQRYKEVGIAGGVTANNISIVDRAEPPTKPSKPNLIVNLILAVLAGLGLGIAAVFVLEALDETLATPEDVEAKLEQPVLGAVPVLDKNVTPRQALLDVRSAFAEAYYSLRSALQFATTNGVPAVLLITSARPGEGKSTTALAIAENFARIGKRVLLMDLDLRNPSMHRLMNVNNEHGMSSILSGAAQLANVVHDAPGVSGLRFVPTGPLPPNPAELLSGSRIQEFLASARKEYDLVVIDGPPVLGFADAPVLAATVEGTVFVIEARSTRRGQARGALKRLNMGNARITGVVLTKFRADKSSYGGYDYAYDYHYGERVDRGRS
ncbi:MAG: polysaccharide biosynthesis tyrosine autokinase [Hyphomicrobiales bacterium]|nr:MAG: polysaccharide biosynthesis tyrosine autokinase [Hyphomicrobiales bacterium]